MKTEHKRVLYGLANCPVCGREPTVVVSSGKQWRIYCENCNLSTPWTGKTDAVIRWFNITNGLRDKLKELRGN